MLNCFSCIQLSATLWTAVHQVLLSVGLNFKNQDTFCSKEIHLKYKDTEKLEVK